MNIMSQHLLHYLLLDFWLEGCPTQDVLQYWQCPLMAFVLISLGSFVSFTSTLFWCLLVLFIEQLNIK